MIRYLVIREDPVVPREKYEIWIIKAETQKEAKRLLLKHYVELTAALFHAEGCSDFGLDAVYTAIDDDVPEIVYIQINWPNFTILDDKVICLSVEGESK